MRVYNFSPGPSMLPLEVLERAAKEMTDTNGTGQSVMEMSHRSKDFKPIIEKAEALVRELLGVPDNYKVLFLQGGASLQFAMTAINLAGVEASSPKKRAAYLETGIWAEKAAAEAAKYVEVFQAASSRDKSFSYIPRMPRLEGDYAYCHITLNNTIVGTKWPCIPDTGNIPLAADISSCILSEPIDISRFGLVYAGAQKNLGPAGLTLVVIREELLGKAPSWTPAMLNYQTHVKDGSMYNTPPCYCIYIMGLVLEWVRARGGAEGMAAINRKKAALLYEYLDNSAMFTAPVERESRSLMNVTFVTKARDETLEKAFVSEAAARGLVNLGGHRLVGGMRASIYNAMPMEGVEALVSFMKDFERNH